MSEVNLDLADLIWIYFNSKDKSELEELGKGQFGKVYKIQYNNVDYAVKLFKDKRCEKCPTGDCSKSHSDYLRELAAYLSFKDTRHKNIIKFISPYIINQNDKKTRKVLIFECAQCSMMNLLFQHIPSKSELSVNYSIVNALSWCSQIADGVAFLHSLKCDDIEQRGQISEEYRKTIGIIHLDLKPANVLLTDNYKIIKITDFGIARLDNKGSKTAEIGTVRYIAPEVLEYDEKEGYDAKCDVYSAGIMFWEISMREQFIKRHFTTRHNSSNVLHMLVCKCTSEKPSARPHMLTVFEAFTSFTKRLFFNLSETEQISKLQQNLKANETERKPPQEMVEFIKMWKESDLKRLRIFLSENLSQHKEKQTHIPTARWSTAKFGMRGILREQLEEEQVNLFDLLPLPEEEIISMHNKLVQPTALFSRTYLTRGTSKLQQTRKEPRSYQGEEFKQKVLGSELIEIIASAPTISSALPPLNRIVVFGGSGTESSMCSVSTAGEEEWQDELLELSRPRYSGAAADLSNRQRVLLVAGSGGTVADIVECNTSSAVSLFASVDNVPLMSRSFCDAIAVDFNTKVVIAGGRDGGSLKSTELFVESLNRCVPLPDMNEARSGLAMAADVTRQANKVFATGGMVSQQTVECFDLVKMRWSPESEMKLGRHEHAAASLGNRVFVVGGGGAWRSAECLDDRESRWQPTTDMIHERFGHRLVAVDDHRLFAIGGHWMAQLSSVEVFDERNRQWRETRPMRTGRWRFQAVLV